MAPSPPPPALDRLHRHLLAQLAALAARVESQGGDLALRVSEVSGWSVGEHADHVVRIDQAVLDALDRALATPPGEGPALTLAGRVSLWARWIPRGVGKAPPATLSTFTTREQLAADLAAVTARLAALAPRLGEIAAGRGRSRHPVFGGLDAAQWLRFLGVHHDHHEKIVRDIVRRRPPGATLRCW